MDPNDWSLRLRKRTQRPPALPDAAPQPAKRRRTSAERRRRERQPRAPPPPDQLVTPHINALPEEVLLYLLSHLNVPDRVRVRAGTPLTVPVRAGTPHTVCVRAGTVTSTCYPSPSVGGGARYNRPCADVVSLAPPCSRGWKHHVTLAT